MKDRRLCRKERIKIQKLINEECQDYYNKKIEEILNIDLDEIPDWEIEEIELFLNELRSL